MHQQYLLEPSWWMHCSPGLQKHCGANNVAYTSGDKHFKPPKKGMLVFDHAKAAVRNFWLKVCATAVASGYVDGCFSDSSEVGSHRTGSFLNASYQNLFEAGKVATMSNVTALFGGVAGEAYPDSATGTLIGKKSYQQGINAYQIEFFAPSEDMIQELMAGVAKGYLVQAHVGVNEPVTTCGCKCMEDSAAAFLIGAGNNTYYGTGAWIAAGLEDVQVRWCPDLFEKPLGAPLGPAAQSKGVYTRKFASGTVVTFDTKQNTGKIAWATI